MQTVACNYKMTFDTSIKEKIKNPSRDFQDFLRQYFDDPTYGLRKEQDTGILQRLQDDEREVAIELILTNLDSGADWLIEAVADLKLEKAIPFLTKKFDNIQELGAKLSIAKALYNWIGFERYIDTLHSVMNSDKNFYKQDVVFYATALDKANATALIFKGLTDKDEHTRWTSYKALAIYQKKGDPSYEENKSYTGENVYQNKQVFERQLKQLREQVEGK
jgi:hypothetical protein